MASLNSYLGVISFHIPASHGILHTSMSTEVELQHFMF